jgi:hypothetical protein
MGTGRWGAVSPRRGSLLGPRQTDFGRLDIAAIKDALSGLEGHVDHRPVSVQFDEPAAVHGPQEARARGIIDGPPGRRATRWANLLRAIFALMDDIG